jgi:hypothetical protein
VMPSAADFQLIDYLTGEETRWFWVSIVSLLILAFAEVMSHHNAKRRETFIATNKNVIDKPENRGIEKNFVCWEERWFWVSIISLVMLGLSEVISHRFAVQKDQLVSQMKNDLDSDQEREIADLKVKLIDSEKQILQLKINLKEAELKVLEANKAAGVAKREADFAKTIVCRFPLRFDPGFPLRTDPG